MNRFEQATLLGILLLSSSACCTTNQTIELTEPEPIEQVIFSIERSHGTGTTGKKSEEYDEPDPRDKRPPWVFGEEIDTDPICCVWNLKARLRAPTAGEIYTRNGRAYLHDFARVLDMQIDMKNSTDAAKVETIQYWKDEKYLIKATTDNPQPIALAPHVAPKPHPGWQWTAGADGWTVDSIDTDRCWPERGITRKGNQVNWNDRVEIGRAEIQAALDQGGLGRTFPHEFTTRYKTDIFCSDRDVCNEAVAKKQESPIASIRWRQRFGIEANRVEGALTVEGTVGSITIDKLNRQVYNWCPSSPFRPGGRTH